MYGRFDERLLWKFFIVALFLSLNHNKKTTMAAASYDRKYFQTLLEYYRSECLPYSTDLLARKQELLLLTILEPHSELIHKRNEAEKKRQQTKKQFMQKHEDTTKEDFEAAKSHYEDLQKQVQEHLDYTVETISHLFGGNDDIINFVDEKEKLPIKFQNNLMKCSILSQQGPQNMAKFCQQYGTEIVDRLFHSDEDNDDENDNDDGALVLLLKEMLVNGGAKNGKFLEACVIYDELMQWIKENESAECLSDNDAYRRLALGTALALASPKFHFGSKTKTIDPKKRFLHYVNAHQNGELDPAFPYFTVWEYRYIVDSDATEEELQWGRDQLKKYYPDHLRRESLPFVYSKQVKTDVAYQPPDWGEDGTRTYQKLISGGGKCGPRAWMGRFLCQAFGVPCWGVRQAGHAALARWTPEKGWVTNLGAAMRYSWWENRHGMDFQWEAHARHYQNNLETLFDKVTLLQCMAHVHQEKSICQDFVLLGGSDDYLWNSLARIQMKCWSDAADKLAKEGIFERQPLGENGDNGKYSNCAIQRYRSRTDDPKKNDNQICLIDDGGMVRIPACAFDKKDQITVMRCFEGGGQVNFQKGKGGYIRYTIPSHVPRQEYQVSCKICTVHAEQEQEERLCFFVNNTNVGESPVIYSAGDWVETYPVTMNLGEGDIFSISRKSLPDSGGKLWGIAVRETVLKSQHT